MRCVLRAPHKGVFYIKGCYSIAMITNLEPKFGSWILMVGLRSMNVTLLTMIARLGERGAARILDGGNRFNAYFIASVAYGRPEVLIP